MKTVESLGGIFHRQRGSHRHYKRKTIHGTYLITIPEYKDIGGDVLRNIIRQTGISRKDFWKAYFGDVPAKLLQDLVIPNET